jgi:hypothetical protein
MESRIDLAADLNDEDDGGFGWSTLSEARDPGRIRPVSCWSSATARPRRSSGWWPSMTTGRCTSPRCPGLWTRTATSSIAPWPERRQSDTGDYSKRRASSGAQSRTLRFRDGDGFLTPGWRAGVARSVPQPPVPPSHRLFGYYPDSN